MRKIISDHDIIASNNLDLLSLVELISIVIKYSSNSTTEIEKKIENSNILKNTDRRTINVRQYKLYHRLNIICKVDELDKIRDNLNENVKNIKSEIEKAEDEREKMGKRENELILTKNDLMEKLIALKVEIEDIVNEQNSLDSKYNSIKTVIINYAAVLIVINFKGIRNNRKRVRKGNT